MLIVVLVFHVRILYYRICDFAYHFQFTIRHSHWFSQKLDEQFLDLDSFILIINLLNHWHLCSEYLF